MTEADRFWVQVDKSAGLFDCWPWMGHRVGKGYGRFKRGRRKAIFAHRVAWALTNGPIPGGLQVRHSCDNPPCVNPAHLLIGTHQDNMDDRTARGRHLLPSKERRALQRGESNPSARLTEAQVRLSRQRHASDRVSYRSLAAEFGVDETTMSAAIRRHTWRHLD